MKNWLKSTEMSLILCGVIHNFQQVRTHIKVLLAPPSRCSATFAEGDIRDTTEVVPKTPKLGRGVKPGPDIV